MILRRLTQHVKAQNWSALAFEFIIVVVGVLAAFWVEGYRERRAHAERTALVIETLRQDMQSSIRFDVASVAERRAGFVEWKAARARGEHPPPYFWRIRGAETPPMLVWDAVLNSSPVELIHPGLLFDLAFYYSEREGIAVKHLRYTAFLEREILPYLGGDPAYFYTADGTELKPQFAAYMDRLRETLRDDTLMHDWTKCLVDRLAEPGEAGESCAPSAPLRAEDFYAARGQEKGS